MVCNDWWKNATIIGRVMTKPIRGLTTKGSSHEIVKITESNGHKFYITNESYEPERKCEPLVIVDVLVKKYTRRRRRR